MRKTWSVAVLSVFALWGVTNAVAQTNEAARPAAAATPGTSAPGALVVTGGAPMVPYRYSYTMVQLHAFPNYQPLEKDIFKLMFERIGTFDYGDDYFFLGVNSDYGEDWSANTETLYFKYAPCLSLDKVFKKKVIPADWLGDFFLTLQVNAGDLDYLRTVWLAGIAFDLGKLPYFGRCRFYALARKEDTMEATHQFTVMWAQPFYTGSQRWIFNGWGAHWDNDYTHDVMKFEPQLRYCLSNFLGKSNPFRDAHIGVELECSNHYLLDPETHKIRGWDLNPSVFFAWPF
jgi:hypothetical protein